MEAEAMMTRDRFDHLADAYGGDLQRWPDAERSEARALIEQDEAARAHLAAAGSLDLLLDAAPRPVASAALRERVIASAAGVRLRSRRRYGFDPLAWVSGAGWAAAACAGVVLGGALAAHMTADLQADAVLYQASLAAADDMEVLGG
jgi:anti-sigma factor RsiW